MYALDVIQQLKILRDYEVGYYTEVDQTSVRMLSTSLC